MANEGLKGSGTWVSCGKPECILWPHSMWHSPSPPAALLFLYLCFSFGRQSQEASCRSHIGASNELGKHAPLILCAHLNPVQLRGRDSMRVMVRVCLCVCVYIPLSLCVVMAVFVLPPRSRWHGPSPSWSPGCPGWRIPVGQGESLPQNGWSYASQSLHLKHTR